MPATTDDEAEAPASHPATVGSPDPSERSTIECAAVEHSRQHCACCLCSWDSQTGDLPRVIASSWQTTSNQEVVLISTEPRVNDKIRAKEVRLVAPDGGQVGIKSIEEARWLADNLGLDLVEVAADARPPVVRMMDYGKFKYEQSVKAREARKKQTRTVIKEVQFRPKIGKSDFDVKRKRVERFLLDNDKVKVTMRFRGREVTHPDIGRNILQRLADSIEEVGVVEQMPRLDGRQMTMVIAPLKRTEKEVEEKPRHGDQKRRQGKAAPGAEAETATASPETAGETHMAPANDEPEADETSPVAETPIQAASDTGEAGSVASTEEPMVGDDTDEVPAPATPTSD